MSYIVTQKNYNYKDTYTVETFEDFDKVMEYIKQYADTYYINDFQVYKVNKMVMTFTVESEE